MVINFNGRYKSLTNFESDNINEFCIITGKNGSGKTQLLELLYTKYASPSSPIGVEIPGVRIIQNGNLLVEELTPFKTINDNRAKTIVGNAKKSFLELKPSTRKLIDYFIENKLDVVELMKMNTEELEKELHQNEDAEAIFDDIRRENGLMSNSSFITKSQVLYFLFRHGTPFIPFFSYISYNKSKKVQEIIADDFDSVEFPERLLDGAHFFASNLPILFIGYARRRYQNAVDFFHKKEFNEINNSVSDLEFLRLNPEPWKVINDILVSRGINYEFDGYERKDNPSFTFDEMKLRSKVTRELVSMRELSSGEKIIVGLIIKLFTSSYYSGFSLTFPDLLLLDEPDAFLHPEMSKLMIEVLYETFVKTLGIKVIMTTHSPSTVALAPDECIYEMKNLESTSLKKITKDHALVILTGNIPTLSIDYNNHRQVFVESPSDVSYYQSLYAELSSEIKMNYRLYFLSNEKGSGNCSWVIDIVHKLRETGMNKVYGIIDWDCKNEKGDYLYVHGYKQRYSVENYLLDPIYLTVLFLKDNNAHGIREELRFANTYREYKLIDETKERLQEVWNWFVDKVEKKFMGLNSSNKGKIEYNNGIEVIVPEWYLTIKGHELEEKLRSTFLYLSKYRNEGQLQHELSLVMAKCYPLVPKDSVELLKKISS